MTYVNPWTGKPVDSISDLLPSPNGGTCDECGSPCIDNCLMCGAPQCCPSCCYDDAQAKLADRAAITKATPEDRS